MVKDTSLLRVTGEIMSLEAGIFSLTIPEVDEEEADRAAVGYFLNRSQRDRVAQDYAQREVCFGELHHSETREA